MCHVVEVVHHLPLGVGEMAKNGRITDGQIYKIFDVTKVFEVDGFAKNKEDKHEMNQRSLVVNNSETLRRYNERIEIEKAQKLAQEQKKAQRKSRPPVVRNNNNVVITTTSSNKRKRLVEPNVNSNIVEPNVNSNIVMPNVNSNIVMQSSEKDIQYCFCGILSKSTHELNSGGFVACSNEDKCLGNLWYHNTCVGFADDYKHEGDWHCRPCTVKKKKKIRRIILNLIKY